MSKFGEILKKCRNDKGWNQQQLALAMGLTQASISQFEKGGRQPTPALVQKFSEVLEVPLAQFMGEEGELTLEQTRLMRNLKGLTPETVAKINAIVEMIRESELPKRQGKK